MQKTMEPVKQAGDKEYPQNKESVIKCGSTSTEKLQASYARKPQMIKPVTVKLDDFRKNLNQVVADSELPPFLLEMVLGEMLSAMSMVAEKERAQDREAWEKSSRAYEEGEENG